MHSHTLRTYIQNHAPTPPPAPLPPPSPGAEADERRGYSMRLHERLCLVARARRLRVAAPVVCVCVCVCACAEQTPTRAQGSARPSPSSSFPLSARWLGRMTADWPGASQAARASWGQGLCMALQRPGLIRHGRCRSRACDLRGEPLIIHAAAINHSTTSLARLLFVVVCATGLHAHSACPRPILPQRHRGLTLLQPARPRQRADARSIVGPPRAVGLHDSLAARLCVAPFVCTMPLDSSQTTARACLARLRPSGEPCCASVRNSPLAEVTIAVPSTPWPQHARIAKSITCLRREMPARPDSPSVAISDRAGPLLHRPISRWRTFAKPCPCENGRCWCATMTSDQ